MSGLPPASRALMLGYRVELVYTNPTPKGGRIARPSGMQNVENFKPARPPTQHANYRPPEDDPADAGSNGKAVR